MRTISNTERGCGRKKQGGVYLVTEPSEGGILPLWISMHPPIPCEDNPHRGPVLVDADAVLQRLPENEWFVGSSAERLQKATADEWAINRFGMTATMRLRTGECVNVPDISEAMHCLLRQVMWNPVHIADAIRNLTDMEIHNMPKAAPHFASFIQHIQKFTNENMAEELVLAAGAVWRIADALPPKIMREDFLPHLMRILVVLNLKADALAMRKRYGYV